MCKHFLDAVEKKQYGWFWSCPNGGKECHYRHALPPGYVLKSQMKALLEEEGEKMSIEEEIENQVCAQKDVGHVFHYDRKLWSASGLRVISMSQLMQRKKVQIFILDLTTACG